MGFHPPGLLMGFPWDFINKRRDSMNMLEGITPGTFGIVCITRNCECECAPLKEKLERRAAVSIYISNFNIF